MPTRILAFIVQRFRFIPAAVAIAPIAIGSCAFFLHAQDNKPPSVWDGIYTDGQAARGEATYREACLSCHGEKLEGRGQTPPLAGSDFTSNWDGMSVGDLFEKMQVSMPADRPGQLARDKTAGILAYILKVNKFPPAPAKCRRVRTS